MVSDAVPKVNTYYVRIRISNPTACYYSIIRVYCLVWLIPFTAMYCKLAAACPTPYIIHCSFALQESNVHFLMGKICKKLKRPDEALRHFMIAQDLRPKDSARIRMTLDLIDDPGIDDEREWMVE